MCTEPIRPAAVLLHISVTALPRRSSLALGQGEMKRDNQLVVQATEYITAALDVFFLLVRETILVVLRIT
jgi:hypothetical protein